jgi:uncharacterized DUF497 family protein
MVSATRIAALDGLRELRRLAMDFEWDEQKSERTRKERGFGFDVAARIFEGPTFEFPDERRDYGELRMVALGAVEEEVLVVVYTDRSDVRRIISARRANRKERKLWRSFASR